MAGLQRVPAPLRAGSGWLEVDARFWVATVSLLPLVAVLPGLQGSSSEESADAVADVEILTPLQQAAAAFHGPLLTRSIPAGATPQEAADHLLNSENLLGRTGTGWIDFVHETYDLDAPSSTSVARASLGPSVLELYDAARIDASQADVTNALARAAAVPLPLQAPLAELVHAVATAYRDQLPLAQEVVARVLADPDDLSQAMITIAERDAMARRAADVVQAVNVFNARWQALQGVGVHSLVPTCLAPVGADCLAYLGSNGADTYAPNPAPLPDPILIVDPEGADVYTNSAGGANPGGVFVPGNNLALSVVADLAGNDLYEYSGDVSVVQGSGSIGGIGLLLDADGDDQYIVDFIRGTTPPAPANVQYYFDGGAQGHGYAGLGLQVDGWGDDFFMFNVTSTDGLCIWGFAQGFGGLGGLGISSDVWGTDTWASNGNGLTGGDDCWGNGASRAFEGLYTQGVGFFGGLGIMTDTGRGNDYYPSYLTAPSVDYYAQGFGGIGGVGILADDGGDDTYIAYEEATGSNPYPNPTLNCAFGTASLGGVGIQIDGGGNDDYTAETVSTRDVVTMMEGDGDIFAAFGLFIDADGVDLHEAIATPGAGYTGEIYGRGLYDLTWNNAGVFVDAGGDADTYIPSPPGSNNAQWTFGVDR